MKDMQLDLEGKQKDKCFRVADLIKRLGEFDPSLPVFYRYSDDPEHCYLNITDERVRPGEVCMNMDEEDQKDIPAIIIGDCDF